MSELTSASLTSKNGNSLGISIPDHVHVTYTDGAAVLMETRCGRYIGLDEVGTRIWQLITELKAPARVLAAMQAEYKVPEDRLANDLCRFLSQCQERGLLLVTSEYP